MSEFITALSQLFSVMFQATLTVLLVIALVVISLIAKYDTTFRARKDQRK